MGTFSSSEVLSISCALILALYGAYNIATGQRTNLPPGPPAHPLVGHLLRMPKVDPEKKFQEWHKTYGDILHVHFFGSSLIILGSHEVARDLLEKKSAIYSDRPNFITLRDLLGWGNSLPMLPYGEHFRRHRRLIQEYLSSNTLYHLRALQELEAATLVQEVLRNPDAYNNYTKRFAAGVIMKLAYGHTVTTVDDEYVLLADKAVTGTTEEASGLMMVDLIPFAKHIPSWFPGGGFKKRAQAVCKNVRSMFNDPYEMVKRSMKSGNVYPSLTSTYIEEYEKGGTMSATDEGDIRDVAGILYSAAMDTSNSALETFILAMVLYPAVYKKAQAEMDRVIGRDRLPELNDRDSLPYLEAIVLEIFRWHPPVAIVSHRNMEDDVYRGYHIPKGSTIMVNIWAISQDSNVYPDPHLFIPERFIGENNLPDSRDIVFGYGRRACPGRQFADSNIWLAIASMTATLHIAKALDEDGGEITPPYEYTNGIVGHPKPFQCVIRARSKKTLDIVNQAVVSRQQ